jgi:hypothetical protein
MITVDLTPCYYCGLPATGKDHAVPRALIKTLADDPDALRHIMWSRRETVPSCKECNCPLGASVQDTLEERKAFLREKLRRRYCKFLAIPDWTEAELTEMRGGLRRYVVFGLEKKAVVMRRLRW